MKLTERISLATAVLNLALLGLLVAANARQDVRDKERDVAARQAMADVPEIVKVFCRKVGCPCTPEPGGCLCCRCGSDGGLD